MMPVKYRIPVISKNHDAKNDRCLFLRILYLAVKTAMDNSTDSELNRIAGLLAKAFDAKTWRVTRDPQSETVFIGIHGLDRFSEDQIERIAGPLLDDIDLEYEEIVLISLEAGVV
jgi:hypothetical protein